MFVIKTSVAKCLQLKFFQENSNLEISKLFYIKNNQVERSEKQVQFREEINFCSVRELFLRKGNQLDYSMYCICLLFTHPSN